MEFTFTATPSTVTTSRAIPTAPTQGNIFESYPNTVLESQSSPFSSVVTATAGPVDPQYDRVSLKKEHGVGNTAQWRKRLITQIEDRVKDKRISIHNARRTGLQQHTSEADLITGGLVSTSTPIAFQTGVEESISETPTVSEEEERRIVAEVWEAFKNENYEALAQAFQGMTDKEVEEIEQDILQHNYTTDYDPTYDLAMDMEMNDMEQTIEHYMRLETSYAAAPQNDSEMASAIALSMTILSSNPCSRCQQGILVFEPVVSSSQSGGVKTRCTTCGFSLEMESLQYIATTARTHR
ncbi:hypothetical protein BGZ49_006867 [Haplosporangium sp. Z 27]|nr:hypothetical protein BGZ49_006867 [Haplosporangium sp. Z 27]